MSPYSFEMSSRRRSRSKERKAISSKLRMDDRIPPPRITDPSLPAGRRREIDNIMKKARAQNSPTSSAIWEKKLLEVEAKDSNRWRHSGYKSLYLDGSSRSRSRSRSFSSARRGGSPSPRRARSPRARSPRSPPPRARSPRSPPPRGRSPRSPPNRRSSPPVGYRGGGRPRTPPSPRKRCVRRSASASSVSSCSDDSCSVCSPKTRNRSRSPRSFSPPPRPSASSVVRKPPPPKPSASRPRPPSPSPSPPPRRMPRPTTPPVAKRMPRPTSSDRPTDPRTRPPPPRPFPKPGTKPGEKGLGQPPLLTRIKKEGAPRKKRTGSPGADSSGSEDSGVSAAVPIVATTAMTLSERFGKIAQWSADRERRDIENMRITKTGSNMKVMVEEDEFLYGTPPRRYSLSPVPQGHYPDELLPSGPSRLAAWDDVRVRYQYYKDLGYLRDLSLDDYVKWEEWWYKYQDWLANERHYEHWLSTHNNSGGRRRKKRVPASQRLGA